MTSIKKKNIIHKKIIKAKNSTEKNILYNEFKRYRNLVTKLSRISKAKHYHHYFTDHKKNMLKTWEGIKLLVNINKRNNKTVNCLNADGVEEMDPFVISNHFKKLRVRLLRLINTFQTFYPNLYNHTFFSHLHFQMKFKR